MASSEYHRPARKGRIFSTSAKILIDTAVFVRHLLNVCPRLSYEIDAKARRLIAEEKHQLLALFRSRHCAAGDDRDVSAFGDVLSRAETFLGMFAGELFSFSFGERLSAQ